MKTLISYLVAIAMAVTFSGTVLSAEKEKASPEEKNAVSGRTNDGEANVRAIAEIADARYEVSIRELARKIAEVGVSEAEIALARIERRIEDATQHGEERDVAFLRLDQKEVALSLEVRKLQVEMSTQELERAKSHLAHLEKAFAARSGDAREVRVEYIDDKDIVVIRGAKEDVAAVTELMQKLEMAKTSEPPTEQADTDVTAPNDRHLRLKQLLQERRAILAKVVEFRTTQYTQGVCEFAEVLSVQRDLLEADLAAAKTPEDRIAVLEKQLDVAKTSASVAEQRFGVGQATQAAVLQARAALLGIEIDILKERDVLIGVADH